MRDVAARRRATPGAPRGRARAARGPRGDPRRRRRPRPTPAALNAVLARGRLVERLGRGRARARCSRSTTSAGACRGSPPQDLLELLRAGPDRIRRCAGHGCVLRFYDGSRGGRRQWCSMAACGNRAKARRHYERARREAATPRHRVARHAGVVRPRMRRIARMRSRSACCSSPRSRARPGGARHASGSAGGSARSAAPPSAASATARVFEVDRGGDRTLYGCLRATRAAAGCSRRWFSCDCSVGDDPAPGVELLAGRFVALTHYPSCGPFPCETRPDVHAAQPALEARGGAAGPGLAGRGRPGLLRLRGRPRRARARRRRAGASTPGRASSPARSRSPARRLYWTSRGPPFSSALRRGRARAAARSRPASARGRPASSRSKSAHACGGRRRPRASSRRARGSCGA